MKTNQAIPLSSIRHNLARVGYTGAALLDRLMSSSRKPVPEIVWINPTGIVARDSTDVVASSDPTVSAALAYIRKNLGRPFGSAEIAEHLGISRTRLDRHFSSPAHFSTAFSQATGISPSARRRTCGRS